MDADDIEKREFAPAFRGYDRAEVDLYLREVAQEVRDIGRQVSTAQEAAEKAITDLNALKAERAKASEPEPAQSTDKAEAYRQVGEETARVLLAAETAANEIREAGRHEVTQMIAEARRKAQQIVKEASQGRTGIEEDIKRLKQTRASLAAQLDDINRRLADAVAKLQSPLEAPPSSARPSRPADKRSSGAAPKPARPTEGAPPHQPPPEGPPGDAGPAASAQASASPADPGSKSVRPAEAAPKVAPGPEPASPQAPSSGKAGKPPQMVKSPPEKPDAKRANGSKPAGDRSEKESGSPRDATPGSHAPPATEAEGTVSGGPGQTIEGSTPPGSDEPGETYTQAPAETEAPRDEMPAQAKTEQAPGALEQTRAKTEQPSEAGERPPSGVKDPARADEDADPVDRLLAEIRDETEAAAPVGPEAPAALQSSPEASEAATSVFDRRAIATEGLPAEAARRLKRILQEDQNELLHRIRTRRGKGSLAENVPDPGEQLTRFNSSLQQVLSRAFAGGREAAGAGGPGKPEGPLGNLIARQVVNPLRAEVGKIVAAGLEAGDTPSAIAERASDVLRVWKGVRTELLGEAMVYAAYHQGLLDAWGRNKKASKKWALSLDEQHCPGEVCRKNAGQGLLALATTFASGHLAPPAHGGCTCTLEGPE